MKSSLSASQRIVLDETSAREKLNSQELENEIKEKGDVLRAQKSVCSNEAHAAVVDVVLLNTKLSNLAHADIKDTNNRITELAFCMDNMSEDIISSVAVLTEEVKKSRNGKWVIPIPLKNGKTLPIPASYTFACFVCVLFFVGWLTASDNLRKFSKDMSGFVETWKEIKAIKAGTASFALPTTGEEHEAPSKP